MVEPSVWGPPFWQTLHYAALGYAPQPTPEQRAAYRGFFLAVGDVIPCPLCREHYKEHLREIPLDEALDNNATLFEWTVRLHNSVNALGGKPQWSVSGARDHYLSRGPASSSAPAPSSCPGPAPMSRAQRLQLLAAVAVGVFMLLLLVLGVLLLTRRCRPARDA